MGGYQFILKQCQIEECDATVFIKGPYCAKHTQGKDLPKPATVATPASTRAAMAPPEEKLEDAITVKTPLPPLGPPKEKNEKKQLSDKKTARKTASSSRPKQSPSVAGTSGSRSSLDRIPVGEAVLFDQRPLKKPRLSNDADKPGLGSHYVPPFTKSASHSSSIFKPVDFEERDGESVASDFALRPKKGIPKSLEVPPRPKPREDQGLPAIKSLNNPQISKQQGLRKNVGSNVISTNGVIDPTQDDEPRPQPPGNGRQASHADTRKDRERPTAEPYARVGQGKSGANTTIKQEPARPNGNVGASNRDGKSYARSTDPDLTPRPAPNNINIAPRPEKLLLSSAPPLVPGLSTTTNLSSTNGYNTGPVLTSSAQTNHFVQEIIEGSRTAHTPRINGAPCENGVNHSDALPSQPEPVNVAGRTYRSQSKESNLSKTQESHVASSHTCSAESSHNAVPMSPSTESASSGKTGKVKKPVDALVAEPSLRSMVQYQDRALPKPEKKRQMLVSEHDSKKFDSYIYGKNNEPFRPGSALFGLPPWRQPPRPTRPATHYAHIDPRIHWSHPRSETWHREKQREIRGRGNRKDNFGRAAARAAKRKLEEGHITTDLPERVKNNPQWLAALDELDEMAEYYHAHKRANFKELKARKERSSSSSNVLLKEKEGEPDRLDEEGDYEMGEDPFDQRNASRSPKTTNWHFGQPT
ncbi:uncharacterized protein F4807DRAFT_464940 [Annulohypoxylon truncatum]|uniref:uncharacterized protein n=1 Tax=Annulohypoxylon truncatum TaxID=327061 RepID=UPI0020077E94|nr:uncharacterized protein F4807DRAFT_464940 [Annulohypoxylon truncatum]KAI1205120.1 hypothetical protein F4807DRAFT_464940 [Annulohypoxylon truncatum]